MYVCMYVPIAVTQTVRDNTPPNRYTTLQSKPLQNPEASPKP